MTIGNVEVRRARLGLGGWAVAACVAWSGCKASSPEVPHSASALAAQAGAPMGDPLAHADRAAAAMTAGPVGDAGAAPADELEPEGVVNGSADAANALVGKASDPNPAASEATVRVVREMKDPPGVSKPVAPVPKAKAPSAPSPVPPRAPTPVPPRAPTPPSKAAAAPPQPPAAYAGPNPCRATKFRFSRVGAACAQGGIAQAKALMKTLVKQGKAQGRKWKCSTCHESLKTFTQKPDAISELDHVL